jgi:hypothetical protein
MTDPGAIIGFFLVVLLCLAAYSHQRIVTWRTRALDAERKSADLWREKFAREWALTIADPESTLETVTQELLDEHHRLQSIADRVLTDQDTEHCKLLLARAAALRELINDAREDT